MPENTNLNNRTSVKKRGLKLDESSLRKKMNEIEIREQPGSNILPFVAGIAVGVVGTIMYATLNRNQFNKGVDKVQMALDRAQEVGQQVATRASEVGSGVSQNIQAKAASASEMARKAVDTSKGVVHDAAGSVKRAAESVERATS